MHYRRETDAIRARSWQIVPKSQAILKVVVAAIALATGVKSLISRRARSAR